MSLSKVGKGSVAGSQEQRTTSVQGLTAGSMCDVCYPAGCDACAGGEHPAEQRRTSTTSYGTPQGLPSVTGRHLSKMVKNLRSAVRKCMGEHASGSVCRKPDLAGKMERVDLWVFEDGSGDGDALLLASRHLHPSLPHCCVIPAAAATLANLSSGKELQSPCLKSLQQHLGQRSGKDS